MSEEAKNEKKPVFGIDLGTTYSAIAYIDETGRPSILKNVEGYQTTPSVVFFERLLSIAPDVETIIFSCLGA